MRTGIVVVLTVLFCLSSAALAGAPPVQKQREAKKYLKAANVHFDAKRWDEAADEYKKALALVHHPDIVWNIARCYEEKDVFLPAILYYQNYLREKGISAKRRTEAEKKVIELQRRHAEATKPVVVTKPPVVEPVVTKPEPAPVKPEPAPTTKPEPTTAAPVMVLSRSQGPQTATWGWVTLGVGAAVGVTGGILLALGKGEYAAVNDAEGTGDLKTGITRAQALDHQDTGDTYITTGWILAGVGGAALVTAIVLVAIDGGEASGRRGVSVSPLLTPWSERGCILGASARF